MATTLEMIEQGTQVSLLTTELNSLANNALVVSSVGGSSGVFNNVQATSNFNAYVRGKVALTLGAPAGTLTANTGAYVWFLKTVDGSTYEDGSASVTPARPPDVVIPVRAVSTAQLIIVQCRLPVGLFMVLLQNAGTGQTWKSTGNTLVVLANTDQQI